MHKLLVILFITPSILVSIFNHNYIFKSPSNFFYLDLKILDLKFNSPAKVSPFFLLYGFSFTTINNSQNCKGRDVECGSFLESNSPDILALCKTNLDDSIDSGNFSVRVIFL